MGKRRSRKRVGCGGCASSCSLDNNNNNNNHNKNHNNINNVSDKGGGEVGDDVDDNNVGKIKMMMTVMIKWEMRIPITKATRTTTKKNLYTQSISHVR